MRNIYLKAKGFFLFERFFPHARKSEVMLFLNSVRCEVEGRGARTHVSNIAPIVLLEDDKDYELKEIFRNRFCRRRQRFLLNSLYRSLVREERDENNEIIKPEGIMPDPSSEKNGNKAYSGHYLKMRRVSLRAKNKALMCLAIIKILRSLPTVLPRKNPKGKVSDVAINLASQLNKAKHGETLEVLEALLNGSYCPLANALRLNVGPELNEAMESEIGFYDDDELNRLGVVVPDSIPKLCLEPKGENKIPNFSVPRPLVWFCFCFMVFTAIGMSVLSHRTIFEIGQSQGPRAAQEVIDNHPEQVARKISLQIAAAYTAYDDGRLDEASEIIDQILGNSKATLEEVANTYYIQGLVFQYKGQFKEAYQVLKMANGFFETSPKYLLIQFNTYVEMARAVMLLGEYQKCELLLEKAYSIWNESRHPQKENYLPQWYAIKLRASLVRWDLDEALEISELQLSATKPDQKNRYLNALADLGWVHALYGNMDKARTITNQAWSLFQEIGSEKMRHYLLVNDYLLEFENNPSAAEDLKLVISDYAKLHEAKELDFQLDLSSKKSALWSKSLNSLFESAYNAYLEGRPFQAKMALNKIYTQYDLEDIDLANYYYYSGLICFYEGLFSQAVDLFERSFQILKEQPRYVMHKFNVLIELARTYVVLREFDNADQLIHKAERFWQSSALENKNQFLPQMYAIKTRLSLARWDLDTALLHALEQLKISESPNRIISALSDLGYVRALRGELTEASKLTERAKALNGNQNENNEKFIQVNEYIIALKEADPAAGAILREIECYAKMAHAKEILLQLAIFSENGPIW